MLSSVDLATVARSIAVTSTTQEKTAVAPSGPLLLVAALEPGVAATLEPYQAGTACAASCFFTFFPETIMRLTLAILGASLALAGCATGPKEEDHTAHHPPGAAVAAAAPAAVTPGHMDSMMKSMQEMHDKLMAAKTPEERAKLMHEHMKLMQDHMAMMGRMRGGKGGMGMGMGGGMTMSPEMMAKRMEMMEMMMRMMMDREGMRPPAGK